MEADATGPTKVQTDGINFTGVWAHSDLIDVDNITTNDVGTTLRIYGVEAARATLMREVRAVFGAYGIGVDPRHLGLIADFMTHMVRLRRCCQDHFGMHTQRRGPRTAQAVAWCKYLNEVGLSLPGILRVPSKLLVIGLGSSSRPGHGGT